MIIRILEKVFVPIITRFTQHREGTVAIEFALIAPILFTMFYFAVEVNDLYNKQRQTHLLGTIVADSIGQLPKDPNQTNLPCRAATTTSGAIKNFMEVINTILPPEDQAKIQLVASGIYINADDTITVGWSVAHNDNGNLNVGDPYLNLPQNLIDYYKEDDRDGDGNVTNDVEDWAKTDLRHTGCAVKAEFIVVTANYPFTSILGELSSTNLSYSNIAQGRDAHIITVN